MKESLGRPKSRWADNIEINQDRVGWEDVDLSNVTQNW